MEFTRQHVVEALRRAGLWDDAEDLEASLPEAVDIEDVVRLCAARGITRDRLVSLLGGSP